MPRVFTVKHILWTSWPPVLDPADSGCEFHIVEWILNAIRKMAGYHYNSQATLYSECILPGQLLL